MHIAEAQGFDVQALAVISGCLIVWSLLASRLERLNAVSYTHLTLPTILRV